MNSSNPTNAGNALPKAPGEGPMKRKVIKKSGADPFFSVSKPRAPPTAARTNSRPAPNANGHLPLNAQNVQTSTPNLRRSVSPALLSTDAREGAGLSGFTDPKVASGAIPYTDYKLVVRKKDIIDGLRFHLMQMTGDKVVDVRDSSQFSQPAHLHRRDPRSAPSGQPRSDLPEPKDGLNPAEREELNKRKEIRQREREANLAQIAPSQGPSRKMNNLRNKTKQVYRTDLTEADKRRIQTNYEEKLPWHLEDFDNKHCYVGENQVGLANVHAALILENNSDGTEGKFRILPVEKVYQFKAKRDIGRMMTIDEAEAAMKRRGAKPEWLLRLEEKSLQEKRKEGEERTARKIFSGEQRTNVAGRTGEEADLDFDEDFADDEEGDLFIDKDEDQKVAEKRIKEDQLTANFFDTKDQKDYDEAEEKERREAESRKQNFRDIRKALERRERNYNHGSDSETQSSTDSEEERERLEREKLENVKQETEKKPGAPASGTNTPSGGKEKVPGTSSDREGKKRLKRPGSPNLSDASGTDTSTRKKLKSRHLSSVHPTSGASRPGSPPANNVARSGAGSDTDAAMSDGAKNRKLKLKLGSGSPSLAAPGRGGSPDSRAGSPGATGANISRPSSTAPTAASAAANPASLPGADEIRAVLRKAGPAGMRIQDLLTAVTHPKDKRKEFVELVKNVARLDKIRGVVVLKD